MTCSPVEHVYVTRKHEVVRFLVGFGVAATEAEDITQDVFLRAIDPQLGARPPENLFRWLLACAKNLAINKHKRARREVSTPGEMWQQLESTLLDSRGSVEDWHARRELLREVRHAFDKLSRIERRCLSLRSGGATFKATAQELDITMDRAIYLTGTAIQKLHRELEGAVRPAGGLH